MCQSVTFSFVFFGDQMLNSSCLNYAWGCVPFHHCFKFKEMCNKFILSMFLLYLARVDFMQVWLLEEACSL